LVSIRVSCYSHTQRIAWQKKQDKSEAKTADLAAFPPGWSGLALIGLHIPLPNRNLSWIGMNTVDELALHKITALLQPFNNRNIKISPETNITADLDIDSVAVMDMIMEVEEDYGISFPVNNLLEIKKVGDLLDAIGVLRQSDALLQANAG
jgi:acyl carrier protein